MDKFLETVENLWENSLVKALVYLVLAFVLAALASFITKKFFRMIKLDAKLDKWGVNEGQNGTAAKFIGKLVFLIVFILFLPAVLGALGLETVSRPISDFAATFIDYIPNIIAAALLIFVGIFIAQIVSGILTIILAKTKIDSLGKKFRKSEDNENEEAPGGVKISVAVGKIVYAVIILVAIVEALTVLDIESVSAPAIKIIETVFAAIPDVFLAILVVAIGIVIANIVAGLLENLLSSVNFDGIMKRIMPGAKCSLSLAKIISTTVRVVIILFVIAEGVKILGLEILTGVTSAVLAYLPMVIKSIAIALIALFGASLVESVLQKSGSISKTAIKLLKAIIYTVATFMILSQLEFATVIVNWAFIITLSALAVAFAIAFGIGGRDFAKNTLDKIDKNDKVSKQ